MLRKTLTAIGFAVFAVLMMLGPADALTSPECPPSHTATLYNQPEGGYKYVYTPNLPGGYSRLIILNGGIQIIELPAPGAYGPGEQFILCYTDDIYAYAQPWADDIACGGFSTVDGCLTLDEYDEMYSFEALQLVESLAVPGRSVADIYSVPPTPRATDRPRLGGEPTIRQVVEGRIWAL